MVKRYKTRTYGCPNIIRTDNAQSELGRTWTQHCCTHGIGTETTEPHHPWQNPAEKMIGNLSMSLRMALLFKAQYMDDDIGKHTLTVPFPILKQDVPLEVAHFIRDNVVEYKRGGYYSTWAKHTLKAHARGICQLYRAYNVDALYRVYKTKEGQRQIKCQRTPEQKFRQNTKIK
jgi:hypothetical protein